MGNEELRKLFFILNSSFSILFAALLLLAGHFLPWAAHNTAALTQSAHDLAISTNFTPGAGIFLNEWFLLPLWSSAILFALAGAPTARPDPIARSGNRNGDHGTLPSPIPLHDPLRGTGIAGRSLALIFALLVASLGLPTYPQVLTAFRNPDYQLQFFITLAVFALIVLIVVLGTRMIQFQAYVVLTSALVSAAPLFGYLLVKPFLGELYGGNVGFGAGWWVTLVGVLWGMATAGVKIMPIFLGKRLAN